MPFIRQHADLLLQDPDFKQALNFLPRQQRRISVIFPNTAWDGIWAGAICTVLPAAQQVMEAYMHPIAESKVHSRSLDAMNMSLIVQRIQDNGALTTLFACADPDKTSRKLGLQRLQLVSKQLMLEKFPVMGFATLGPNGAEFLKNLEHVVS